MTLLKEMTGFNEETISVVLFGYGIAIAIDSFLDTIFADSIDLMVEVDT